MFRISFFYTPKPRQFEYKPRFYDPVKEELEALKKKYEEVPKSSVEIDDELLKYYEEKAENLAKPVRKKAKSSFFGKKQITKFDYQPRFYSPNAKEEDIITSDTSEKYTKTVSMKRSSFYDNKLFAERISVTKIISFIVLAVLLLLWIFL